MTDDPAIVPIEDVGEFLAEQARIAAFRNERLHDRQRQITWGSFYARFYPINRSTVLTIFARVEDVEQFKALEEAAGATGQELDTEVQTLTDMHENGYLFARHHSTMEPTGEWGTTHRYNCWPIDEQIYQAAQEAGWDVSAMTPTQRDRLQAEYDEFRAWVVQQEV